MCRYETERLKKEQLKKDGKLLTNKQKEEQKRLEVGGCTSSIQCDAWLWKRTDGAGIRTPDLLIPAERLVSTLEPIK